MELNYKLIMQHLKLSEKLFSRIGDQSKRLIGKRFLLSLTLLSCFVLISTLQLNAQGNYVEPYQNNSKPCFKLNKGQVADFGGNELSKIKYLYETDGMKVALKKNGISYGLYSTDKKSSKISEATGKPVNTGDNPADNITYHYQKVDLQFVGANDNPEVVAKDQTNYYTNYYLGHCQAGITNVYGYRKVVYKNLYDNIDLVLKPQANDKGQSQLKYDIIVRPGGDLSDVKMAYKGMDNLTKEDGKLSISTSEGKMKETIPASYWAENHKAVKVNYRVNDNVVSFEAESNKKGQTLVVDPKLSWSTFLGDNSSDRGKSVATDANNNTFIIGETTSSNFPVTSGAYQSSNNGLEDVFLSKFSSDGNLIWSTYIGGVDTELGQGIETNGNGDVFISGVTSSSNFPTTGGAYQSTISGSNDAFLSKFSGNGSLNWSTFLGGNSQDDGQAVATDINGNVFITGNTESANFPTTSGAYQGTLGGSGDGYVTKFTGTGSLSWSTFFGGNNKDMGKALATDNNGNVFVTGNTNSSNFPTTSGAYQTTFNGGMDAFLYKLSSGGSLSWSTYLGGNNNESGQGIATDNVGNVIVTGNTQSANFPTSTGAYQTSYGGAEDAFVSKFLSGGNFSWSTYLGGTGEDIGRSLATDGNRKALITGTTNSFNFPASSGSYQPSKNGKKDAFISKLSTNGGLSFSSFVGGSEKDLGKGIATDTYGNAFMTGSTESSNFPTERSYQNSNAGFDDAYLTKFANCQTALTADFTSDSVCQGNGSVQFKDNSTINSGSTIRYDWNFGDGNSGNGSQVSHFYQAPGNYSVELIVTLNNGCKDTAIKNSTAFATPKADFAVNDLAQCREGNVFRFTDQSSISSGSLNYAWNFDDGIFSNQRSPNHTYNSYGNYNVELTVTSGDGCQDQTSINVEVYPMPNPNFAFTDDTAQCFEGNLFDVINNSTIPNGNLTYSWDFGDGYSSSLQSPSRSYNNPGTYTIELVATSNQGCVSNLERKVKVGPKPNAQFGVNDSAQCIEGNNFRFFDQSSIGTGRLNYNWDFGDSSFSQARNPSNQYNDSGDFTVTLQLTSDIGCRDSAKNGVRVHPMPVSDFEYKKVSYDTVAFNPVDSSLQSYLWDFGDGILSENITTGHSYDSSASYDLKLTVTSEVGCQSSTMDTLTLTSVGTEDKRITSTSFRAYPNPFRENVSVKYELSKAHDHVELIIVDQSGRMIQRQDQGSQKAGEHVQRLRGMQDVSSGTYFIRLITSGQQKVERVVKVK